MEEYEFHINKFSLMTSLLAVVNENSSESSAYVLARYFLEHFAELDKLNIYDVADECYVSRSGIQRFCKSIGFDTFSSLKTNSLVEREIHRQAIVAYARRPDFADYTRSSMGDMMEELERMAGEQDLAGFARKLYESRKVVLLTAEYSSMGPRDLQQELLVAGKFVSLATDSHIDFSLLRSLGEEDMLIVSSATGNYAYAVNDVIRELPKPCRVLLTLNRDTLFREAYDKIFYLSGEGETRQRSVYTKYGVGYFFDLLYNSYIQTYCERGS